MNMIETFLNQRATKSVNAMASFGETILPKFHPQGTIQDVEALEKAGVPEDLANEVADYLARKGRSVADAVRGDLVSLVAEATGDTVEEIRDQYPDLAQSPDRAELEKLLTTSPLNFDEEVGNYRYYRGAGLEIQVNRTHVYVQKEGSEEGSKNFRDWKAAADYIRSCLPPKETEEPAREEPVKQETGTATVTVTATFLESQKPLADFLAASDDWIFEETDGSHKLAVNTACVVSVKIFDDRVEFFGKDLPASTPSQTKDWEIAAAICRSVSESAAARRAGKPGKKK